MKDKVENGLPEALRRVGENLGAHGGRLETQRRNSFRKVRVDNIPKFYVMSNKIRKRKKLFRIL